MEDSLQQLRQKIDAVDDELLALLAKRCGYVEQVGHLKAASGVKIIIRPGREVMLIQKAASFSQSCHLSEAALASLWRIIISASSQIEQPITVGIAPSATSTEHQLYVQAFYGSFVPRTPMDDTATILRALSDHRLTVGAFAGNDTTLAELLPSYPDLRIFAALPFANSARWHDGAPLYLVGAVTPEATGDDLSLFIHNKQILAAEGFIATLPTHPTAYYAGSIAQPVLITR